MGSKLIRNLKQKKSQSGPTTWPKVIFHNKKVEFGHELDWIMILRGSAFGESNIGRDNGRVDPVGELWNTPGVRLRIV